MREVIRIVIMVAVLLTVVLGVCLIVSAKDKQEPEEKTGYIFIGDSRTTGMNDAVHMELMDDTFVVAKNDAGYEWYMKEGSSIVYDIRCDHPEYTKWIYIINLGINDLNNIDNYKSLYRELTYEAIVYYETINPTDDNVGKIQCSQIEEFNKSLRYYMPDEDYINSYEYLLKVSGFEFTKKNDGINYNEKTYKTLYDFIMMAIEVHEFVKENDNRYSAYYYLYNAR